MAVLEQMPPNIQDIARRRPELVRQMFLDRQRRQRLSQFSEEQQLLGDESDDASLDDNDDDDETTSLIQRRRRPKYKSIDGGGS